MHGPSSIGQRRLICQCWADHASFGEVCSRTEVGNETLCGLHWWCHVLEGAAPQEELLEGWTLAPIPVETPAAPITKELEGTQVQESGALPFHWETEEPTEEPATTKEPPDEPGPFWWSPQKSPLKNQPLQRSLLMNWPFWWLLQRSPLLSHCFDGHCQEPAGEPDIPLCSARREKKGKFHIATSLAGQRCYILPGEPCWVEPSELLASWGGNAAAQSAGGRRAWHQWAEECKRAAQEESNLTWLSPGSPKPRLEIAPPPGFRGVAACLLRDSPSPAPIEVPQKQSSQMHWWDLQWQWCTLPA